MRQNEGRLKRFQLFEAKALTLNSLAELIEFVLDDTLAIFDLDVTGVGLVGSRKDIDSYLRADGIRIETIRGLFLFDSEQPVRQVCGKDPKPYVGKYAANKFSAFFSHVKEIPTCIAVVPLWRRGRYLGAIILGSRDAAGFEADMSIGLLEHMGSVVSVCFENCLNFELLQKTSLVDSLTGVNNRLFLEQRIGEEISRTLRSGEPLACVFFDIDYFKRVNDTYGHQMGDKVLAKVAGVIRSQLRNSDVLARYGGEEFVSLLSGCNEKMAFEIAERIRTSVDREVLGHKDGVSIKVTLSAGIATYELTGGGQGRRIEQGELLAYADQALYEAKNKGRNCVVSRGPVPIEAAGAVLPQMTR